MSAIVDLAGRALWPVVSAVKEVGSLYSEINPATLSGAIDIVVIKQENGDWVCSPFHVRFGKLKLFRPSEKLVELNINGKVVEIPMKVGDAGEAFFVVEAENPVPSEYATSPIVAAVEPPVQDETLKDFSLATATSVTDGSTSVVINQTAASVSSTTPHLQIDPTLSDEMDLLHIGGDEPQTQANNISKKGDDEEFASKEDLPRDAPSSSTFIPGVPAIASSLPVEIQSIQSTKPTAKIPAPTASSPPWSWQWGGLPERQPEGRDATRDDLDLEQQKRRLQNRASTPLLRHGITTPPPTSSGMMTINEKVGNFLESGIPSSPEEPLKNAATAIALNQDFGDEATCQAMVAGISADNQLVAQSQAIICSSCGPLSELQKLKGEEAESRFVKKEFEFEDFCDRPDILMAPTTIYKIYGFFHSWNTAAPIIMSQVLFHRPLSADGLRLVMRREEKSTSSGWFSWGRSTTLKKHQTVSQTQQQTGLRYKASEPIMNGVSASPTRGSRLAATSVAETESLRSSSPPPSDHRPRYNYAKSLRLSSDQLKSLDLQDGINTVQFSVYSSFQGKAVCSAKIFLWNHDTKIVISDVDGTITKSDVLGHVFTMVGRDWTHAGVANLYTNISKNGYQFLYLTSRAIGQAGYTREYLANVEQDQLRLPEGPVLLSPDRLVQAFTREVIQRRPQEFKMQCLKDVKRLFGPGASPFYAGFGNRITDAMSYRSVDIPSSRIFTIDPSGEVKLELLANFKTSYVKLNDTVDQVFPPGTSTQDPDFSDFSYWKSDYSSIQIDVPDGGEVSEQMQTVSLVADLESGRQDEDEEDDFGDAEEVSIASLELQEHLSAMQNTKF